MQQNGYYKIFTYYQYSNCNPSGGIDDLFAIATLSPSASPQAVNQIFTPAV